MVATDSIVTLQHGLYLATFYLAAGLDLATFKILPTPTLDPRVLQIATTGFSNLKMQAWYVVK